MSLRGGSKTRRNNLDVIQGDCSPAPTYRGGVARDARNDICREVIDMHYVSKIDTSSAKTPSLYERSSLGFRRAAYVERAMGSVHMGTGICYLDANGFIQPHL